MCLDVSAIREPTAFQVSGALTSRLGEAFGVAWVGSRPLSRIRIRSSGSPLGRLPEFLKSFGYNRICSAHGSASLVNCLYNACKILMFIRRKLCRHTSLMIYLLYNILFFIRQCFLFFYLAICSYF